MTSLKSIPPAKRTRPYRGSAMLRSSWGRMLCMLPVLVLIWAMTAWAMGWLSS